VAPQESARGVRWVSDREICKIFMKCYLVLTLAILQLASPAVAEDRVTRFIESDVPLIIDGNWLYPENGGYTLVMTDEYLTINGYEYVHPEDKSFRQIEPPSREKDFVDWVIRTTADRAQQIVDKGGSRDDARAYMESTFEKHVGEQGFRYEIDKRGLFTIYYSGSSLPVYVAVPSRPRREPPPYRERIIKPLFTMLRYYLERGYLVMLGTNGTRKVFAPEDADGINKELRNVQKRAEVSVCAGEKHYLPITLEGRYTLLPSEVELLVNPRKLVRR